MKHLLSLFILLLASLPSRGQTEPLPTLLHQAFELVTTVETQKYRYEQSFTFEADRPWEVEISVGEFSLKNGKGETMMYRLNLSDLDKRLINYEDDKNELTVALKTTRRQKLIRVTNEEGEVKYEDEVMLWSNEIDEAKALVDLLRAAIPSAENVWKESFSPGTTTEELNDWLTDQVSGTDEAGVSWSADAVLTDQVVVTVTPAGETTITYRFSLADVAAKSLELSVRKGEVSVAFGTIARTDLIQVEKDGMLDDYTGSLSLPVADIDAGRRLIQSLESAIPLAKKIRAARMPDPGSLEDGLSLLSELLGEVARKGEVVTPTITSTPVSTLTIKTMNTDKGEESAVRQLFDFGDLDPKGVELRVKGTALNIMAETKGGKDYVQRWEEEEDDGFEDELAFPVSTVEAARRLEALLPYLMAEAAKLPPQTGDMAWLRTAAEADSGDDVRQSLDENGDPCKWKLTVLTEGKKVTEVIYELNLYDLDKDRVDYETDSKGVRLILPTLKNEKIINVLDDGEPEFTDELVIKLASLAAAKKAAATIKEAIEGCLED